MQNLIADILGIIGGAVLALCLVPQVHQAVETQSVDDISFGWLIVYLVGLMLNLAYFILIDAVVAWATLLIEIFFCILMIFLKFYFGRWSKSSARDDIEDMKACNKINEETPWQQSPVHVLSFNGPHGDSKNYRGHHFLFDYTFTSITSARPLADKIFALMKKVCDDNNVHYVFEKTVVFDESDESAPPGFTSALLIDESHITAHCYSKIGLLALDIFTCGSNPEQTYRVARELHEGVLNMTDQVRNVSGHYRETPRFPLKILPEMDNAKGEP